MPPHPQWGDFTTAQRRRYARGPDGRFTCSMCNGLTDDPLSHGFAEPCFAAQPTCEVAACQRPIAGVASVLFGAAGAATREAHAHCYLPSQGRGLVWLW